MMTNALKSNYAGIVSNSIRTFTISDYFIAFSAILVVSPFFSTVINVYSLIALLFTLIIAIKRRIRIIDRRILSVIALVYLLILVQSVQFGGVSYASFYYPLMIFYWPYLLFSLYGKGVVQLFSGLIYAIAIFTLPFWLLQSVSLEFDSILRDLANDFFSIGWDVIPRSLIFYTSAWSPIITNDSFGVYRNSGLFHEPGAFATFLFLSLILNTYLNGKLFDKKNIVFIFCIITTFSTAAYIGLFGFLLSVVVRKKINLGIKIFIIVFFLLFVYQSFVSLDFLGAKITGQYSEEITDVKQHAGIYEGTRGRFFSFFVTLQFFMDNPVFGRGIVQITGIKQAGLIHEKASTHFGPLAVLAYYGIFAGIFYLVYIYYGLKAISKNSVLKYDVTIVTYTALMAVLSTQAFILTTIMVYIFILGLYEKIEHKKLHKKASLASGENTKRSGF